MAWLYEEGIGENRAVRVEQGAIVEALIEWPEDVRLGAVVDGRLTAILIPGRRGLVTSAAGEIFVEPLPPKLTQGQSVRIEITREPIAEPGHAKRPKGRITDAPVQDGPGLCSRIQNMQALAQFGPDRLEEAGWSELLEEAISGEIDFPGGSLRMSLTPAMTLFDVDGLLPLALLAVAGAAAVGRAIRRLGITGSIGIDLPTLASKDDRQAAAAALDAVLPQPFERTAVNGFGFLQVVRRRERASIPEMLRDDPAGAAARALLRRAERATGAGATLITAAPTVIARLEREPAWMALLEQRTGRPARLQADAALTIFGGHVQSAITLG